MQSFTELARKYGNDPRVAILGCVSTDTPEQARDYIKKLGLDFPHTSDTSLMNRYYNSWPSAAIVGRDGKLLQKHLSDETLRKYLAIALGERDEKVAKNDKVTR
jgi:peroxiredoxin